MGKEVHKELPGLRGPAGLEQRFGQEQPERSYRTGGSNHALGIKLEEPADASDRSGRIVQLGACRSEDQKTSGFPPRLSYQSLGCFLGRIFPVILMVKLGQRV